MNEKMHYGLTQRALGMERATDALRAILRGEGVRAVAGGAA